MRSTPSGQNEESTPSHFYKKVDKGLGGAAIVVGLLAAVLARGCSVDSHEAKDKSEQIATGSAPSKEDSGTEEPKEHRLYTDADSSPVLQEAFTEKVRACVEDPKMHEEGSKVECDMIPVDVSFDKDFKDWLPRGDGDVQTLRCIRYVDGAAVSAAVIYGGPAYTEFRTDYREENDIAPEYVLFATRYHKFEYPTRKDFAQPGQPSFDGIPQPDRVPHIRANQLSQPYTMNANLNGQNVFADGATLKDVLNPDGMQTLCESASELLSIGEDDEAHELLGAKDDAYQAAYERLEEEGAIMLTRKLTKAEILTQQDLDGFKFAISDIYPDPNDKTVIRAFACNTGIELIDWQPQDSLWEVRSICYPVGQVSYKDNSDGVLIEDSYPHAGVIVMRSFEPGEVDPSSADFIEELDYLNEEYIRRTQNQ
jgi:hypothetical protein